MRRGVLWRVSALYWFGSALMLGALVSATLAGPRFPSAFTSIVPLVLLVGAAAGMILLVVAVWQTVRAGVQLARARHAGQPPIAVLAATTGHVAASLCSLAGGMLALPVFFGVVLLGSIGRANANAVWLSIVVPLLLGLLGLGFAARDGRSSAAGPRDPQPAPAESRSRVGSIGVLVTTLAAATLIILVLPLLVVAMLGPSYWMLTPPGFANSNAKVAAANIARPYGVPKDPRIGALAAGEAFDALMRSTGNDKASRFATRPQAAVPYGPPPWNGPIPGNLFRSARSNLDESIPATGAILQAASHGFRPDETAYLEGFAHAGQWRDFAIVARAPAFDYIGARYQLPFADSAGGWWDFPTPPFATVKALAYAGVSRAAYYLARGQRDSAEIALREIVSFGFTFVDQGNTVFEQLIGSIVVGIGRQSLTDYYHVIGDPRGVRLAALWDSATTAGNSRVVGRVDRVAIVAGGDRRDAVSARAEARRVASDSAELRGARLQMLTALSLAPCTNLRELVFGPDDDVRASFALARAKWARFASDTALLDLVYRTVDHIEPIAPDGVIPQTAMGASVVAGRLLRNRRLPGCAALFLGQYLR